MGKVALQTLKSGAVIDLFNAEYEKVLANIDDVNTKPNATRSIKIELKLTPDESRKVANIQIAASSRLAPTMPAKTIVYFGCENGQLAAYEDDPRQQALDFKAGTVSAIGG